ncbi:putative gibberellin 2-beta-dioxygenase 2-like [Capsicum annuum]|nr:putative gibberellin 2-beta-dioxygenase 2-like [Capsicum annuum]
MKHVYKKSSSNYERPSQEDNQAYEDESNGDSDDVNESDNPDNINASDSDPDGNNYLRRYFLWVLIGKKIRSGGSGSGSGSGSGATVGANDAPLEIFETIKHYDYDHTSFIDFAPLSECSACKCQNCKAKYNGVINAINTLTTSVKELTSNSGVILSNMISYPYTSLEIKAARRRRKEFSKALSSIEKRKIATPPFL